MPARCPGCATELDATNTNCPVCLRSRSRKEIAEDLRRDKEQRGRPRRKRQWAAVASAAVALATLSFRAKSPTPPLETAAPPARAPEPPAPAAPERPPPIVMGTPSPAPQAPPKNSLLTARRRGSSEVQSQGWSVSGLVYDLMTLKPVAAARLVFQDKNSGKAFDCRSGGDGRYKIVLPRVNDGGYELSISHRAYQDAYLEEMSPPYRSQSRARRVEAAEQLSGSELLHVPLLPERRAAAVKYDLILFQRH